MKSYWVKGIYLGQGTGLKSKSVGGLKHLEYHKSLISLIHVRLKYRNLSQI